MNKVAMVSLGCSKNLVDAEQMLGIIDNADFEIVENEEDADILIVNTCSFIKDAKEESIETILEMAEYKKTGKCKCLLVTGCMAQRYKEEVLANFPEVDCVIGTGEYDKIADIITDFVNKNNIKTVQCGQASVEYDALPRIRTTPEYTAYLKIAEGCDNCCTYCVIPSIRGRYKSRRIEDIILEAEKMANDGVRELIIIAQDTTAYGKDLYAEYRLVELLRKLSEIEKIKWIRIHYCYPERITDELIDEIAGNEKICKYLDIPIQHCNDNILKKMARRTNKIQLVELINKIRAKIPEAVIRTTLIVGFPTESDEQFEELLEFAEAMRFDRLGVFAYSQEEGTVAGNMEGQIDEEVKTQRQEAIMLKQSVISEELNEQKLERAYEVLVEGYDSIIKQYYGRTYADSIEIDGKVFFTSSEKLESGEFVNVTVTDYMEYDLFGEVKS